MQYLAFWYARLIAICSVRRFIRDSSILYLTVRSVRHYMRLGAICDARAVPLAVCSAITICSVVQLYARHLARCYMLGSRLHLRCSMASRCGGTALYRGRCNTFLVCSARRYARFDAIYTARQCSARLYAAMRYLLVCSALRLDMNNVFFVRVCLVFPSALSDWCECYSCE